MTEQKDISWACSTSPRHSSDGSTRIGSNYLHHSRSDSLLNRTERAFFTHKNRRHFQVRQLPEHRMVKMVKTLEDGRPRSPLLPRLGRPATFEAVGNHSPDGSSMSRQKTFHKGYTKKYISKSLQPESTHDGISGLWSYGSLRKCSFELDTKIVKHLRRKLSRRMERHLTQIMDAELKLQVTEQGDSSSWYADTPEHAEKVLATEDIFGSYNDLGEKVTSSHQGSDGLETPEKPSSEPAVNISRAVKLTPTIRRKQPILPEIKMSFENTDSMMNTVDYNCKVKPDTNKLFVNGDQIENKESRLKVAPVFGLTKVDTEVAETTQNNYHKHFRENKVNGQHTGKAQSGKAVPANLSSEVSPVPTPVVYRPESYGQVTTAVQDKVEMILKGDIKVRVTQESKVLQVYIHSAVTDTDVERTALLEKVYPALKSSCRDRGYELRILDLHWGMYEGAFDDHSHHKMCLDVLADCKGNSKTLNFVTFLGQKYGDPLLPTVIPVHEFNKMMKLAMVEYQADVESAQARAAMIQTQKHGDAADNELKAIKIPIKKADQKPKPTVATDKNVKKRTNASLLSVKSSLMQAFKKTVSDLGRKSVMLKVITGDGRQDNSDPILIQSWYLLDNNAVPPVYRLQKVSSHYADILRNDVTKRQQARGSWTAAAHKLQRMLHRLARETLHDKDAVKKYNTSLSELEIEQGVLFCLEDPAQHCFWFQRHIDDIEAGLNHAKIQDYLDLLPMTSEIDNQLSTALMDLKENRLPTVLPEKNIAKYSIPWHMEGVSPPNVRAHHVYVEQVCRDFRNMVTRQIHDTLSYESDQKDNLPSLFRDINQHVNLCHTRSRSFHGRKDTLISIKKYIRGDKHLPLVIHGQPGSGKTSIIAKAAKDTNTWLKGIGCAVLVRFIGITGDCTNIRLLLHSLCLQLGEIFNNSAEQVSDEYKGLENVFSERLSQATAERPLVIFLDSLHLLTDENKSSKFGWIPKKLPSHVRLIVSTIPEDNWNCLKQLEKQFPGDSENFLEVPDLPAKDADTILEHWYSKNGRTLRSDQREHILQSVKQCPLPLYLKTIFRESLKWPSYLPVSEIRLGNSMKSVAVLMFGRLEKEHGEALVRRALGYITAAKNGLCENEMEDLLSLDDAVMDDISAHSKLQVRRLPSAFWVRLRNELDECLNAIPTDGCVTLNWAHSLFYDVATERYLNSKDKAPSYHKALAEYFSNRWFEIPKPHSGSDRGSLRCVMSQPLYSLHENNDGQLIYNLRRLNELPFHFLHSQQMELLKSECLCNYEFLLARLSATSLRCVFDDLQMALAIEPSDPDLRLLSETLTLSQGALLKDSRQLGSQIVGRLHEIITKDVPVSRGDPVKYRFLKPLFEGARKSSIPTLIPSATCLSPPGGLLCDLLSGHTEPITAVIISPDGQRAVTTSCDNTLKVWELRTGRVVQSINAVGSDVLHIRLALNSSLAITSETSCIRVWNLTSGDCVKCIRGNDDPASLTVANSGQLLAAFFHGSNVMRVWNLEDSFALTQEVQLTEDDQDGEVIIHKDNSTLVSASTSGYLVLHAYKSGSEAVVRNVKTGKVVYRLKCKESGSIQALACSRDYFICAARYQYMKLHEIYQLELFDITNGHYVRGVRGCVADNFHEIMVNQMGSHAFAICSSEASNSTDIAVWNLETEEHKHLAKHAKVSHCGACADMRYCVTAAVGDNNLRIWNLSGKVNQPVPREKVKTGLDQIYTFVDNQRYVITKSFHNDPVCVWNLTNARYAGVAVRKESGFLEDTDVVLVRGTRLVILKDKGYSSTNDDKTPVFQTILIYDLVTKKIISKIHGCYIFPCPVHEYVLLDDEHLLGLSGNRTHLVVWSLIKGDIVYRIKPNFRELQRQKTEIDSFDKQIVIKNKRNTTAKMTPWDRRCETRTAKRRRHIAEMNEERERAESLRAEKDNGIEQFLISKDMTTLVASFYSHHLCVFDIPAQKHIHTFENVNSLLLLHVAALTDNGNFLVHTNYEENTKISYVTLWDCRNGWIKKRLTKQKNVCAIAISDNAERIVFGKTNKELRIWEPRKPTYLRKIKGYSSLKFGVGSKIHLIENGCKAIVYAGDISVWDLEKCTVLAIFTPDTKIQCFTMAMEGELIVFGLRDSPDIVTLKLMSRDMEAIREYGEDVFGECDASEDDDEEEEEET